MSDERNYGIDALRLFLMLMIIVHHLLLHGAILKYMEPGSLRYAEAWLFEVGTFCAVNCFAMISGYVGVKSKDKLSNMLYLWLQVWLYAMLMTGVVSKLYPGSVDSKQWQAAMFPVTGLQYWYYTAYIGVMAFAPILKRALNAMSFREARYCVLVLFVVFSVYQTFCREVFPTQNGYSMIWLVIMYVIGGYCRLYGDEDKWFLRLKKHGVWVYGSMVAISLGFKLISESMLRANRWHGIDEDMLIRYISPTIVLCAVALLAVFSQWKPNAVLKKYISLLSPSAFCIYLIHDHDLIRLNFIVEEFAQYSFIKAYLFPFALIFTALAIFGICIAVDLIRRKIFDLLKVKSLCVRICSGLEKVLFG